MNSDILIYQNQDGNIKIDLRLEEETVWLTQAHMGALFGKDKRTISEHLGNVFREGELDKNSTVRKFRTVQMEGSREVELEIDQYNIDVIISVDHRLKSIQRTPMYMADWIKRLDSILQLNGRELLSHAGKISHQKALEKSEAEFEKYQKAQKVLEKEESLKELEADMNKLRKPKT